MSPERPESAAHKLIIGSESTIGLQHDKRKMSRGASDKAPPFLSANRKRGRPWNQSPASTNATFNESGIVNSIKRFVGGLMSPSKPYKPTQDLSIIEAVRKLFHTEDPIYFIYTMFILGDSIEQKQ